ncbi:pre-mRNA-splicing factor 38B-like [Argopecten irradians]|uniref:pre-mRNA-splicing factor 38B-like n=1 Tax=Argopecten irradians TaxID=31199 RepID=UPI00371B3BE4
MSRRPQVRQTKESEEKKMRSKEQRQEGSRREETGTRSSNRYKRRKQGVERICVKQEKQGKKRRGANDEEKAEGLRAGAEEKKERDTSSSQGLLATYFSDQMHRQQNSPVSVLGNIHQGKTENRKRKRSQLDEQTRENVCSTETENRKRKRSQLDEQKKENIKHKDTTSRQSKRSQLDEQKKGSIKQQEHNKQTNCHTSLVKSKMPAMATSNNLKLLEIPKELKDLGELERLDNNISCQQTLDNNVLQMWK